MSITYTDSEFARDHVFKIQKTANTATLLSEIVLKKCASFVFTNYIKLIDQQ